MNKKLIWLTSRDVLDIENENISAAIQDVQSSQWNNQSNSMKVPKVVKPMNKKNVIIELWGLV